MISGKKSLAAASRQPVLSDTCARLAGGQPAWRAGQGGGLFAPLAPWENLAPGNRSAPSTLKSLSSSQRAYAQRLPAFLSAPPQPEHVRC